MKRTFRIKVLVRGCNVTFQAGLDRGVLGQQDVTYNISKKDFKRTMFAKELLDRRAELLDELVFTEIQEMEVVE